MDTREFTADHAPNVRKTPKRVCRHWERQTLYRIPICSTYKRNYYTFRRTTSPDSETNEKDENEAKHVHKIMEIKPLEERRKNYEIVRNRIFGTETDKINAIRKTREKCKQKRQEGHTVNEAMHSYINRGR